MLTSKWMKIVVNNDLIMEEKITTKINPIFFKLTIMIINISILFAEFFFFLKLFIYILPNRVDYEFKLLHSFIHFKANPS